MTSIEYGPEPPAYPLDGADDTSNGQVRDHTPPPVRDSPLGSLKARRERQQQHLYLDVLVPGWHEDPDDPAPISIYVRCAPVKPSQLGRASEARRKQRKKSPDWVELMNADVLVDVCRGVYALEGAPADDPETDERPKLSLRDGDEHGDWTRFDRDLAHSLGLDPESAKAVDVVLALFPKQAQIVSAVNELVRWSGVEAPQSDQDFFGS
jgi:hypothetical protein